MTKDPQASESLFSALRSRNFVFSWTGQWISGLGNAMYTLTMGWTAYRLTRSPVFMSLILLAYDTPQIAFMLMGGAIADRFSRRKVLITSDCSAGLVTAALAATQSVRFIAAPALIAGSFLLGGISSFFLPAYGAINRELVPAQNLRSANALRSAASNVARVTGPVIGGIAYATGGATLAFGLDATSFFISALALSLTNISSTKVKYESNLFGEIKDGIRYMARTAWLRSLILIGLVGNALCLAPYFVLLPLVVKRADEPVSFLGIAMTSQAVATGACALLIGKWGGKVPAGRAFYILFATLGLGVAFVGAASDHPLAILGGVAIVGMGTSVTVVEDTMLQNQIPEKYLSRVYSAGMFASYSLLPLGYVLSGVLAKEFGSSLILICGGGLLMITAGAVGTLSKVARQLPAELPEETSTGRASAIT